MIKRIKENIWQLYFKLFGSCVYLLKIENKLILVDASSKETQAELLNDLEKLHIKPEQIELIILTHNHWDHIGNIDIF